MWCFWGCVCVCVCVCVYVFSVCVSMCASQCPCMCVCWGCKVGVLGLWLLVFLFSLQTLSSLPLGKNIVSGKSWCRRWDTMVQTLLMRFYGNATVLDTVCLQRVKWELTPGGPRLGYICIMRSDVCLSNMPWFIVTPVKNYLILAQLSMKAFEHIWSLATVRVCCFRLTCTVVRQ